MRRWCLLAPLSVLAVWTANQVSDTAGVTDAKRGRREASATG